MFKGFSRKQNYNGFPNINVGMSYRQIEAFGFPSCKFWVDPEQQISATSNLELINFWVDLVNNNLFQQPVTTSQPRLLKSEPSFGGRDIIDFQTAGRGLFTSIPITVNVSNTIAIVYHPYSYSLGGSQQNRLIGDNEFSNARSLGSGFSYNVVNNFSASLSVGYHSTALMQYATNDVGVYNTNVKILVFTKGAIVSNGVSYPVTNSGSPDFGFLMSYIGGGLSQIMRIGDILIFEKNFSISECIALSDNINTKYAIY